MWQVSPGCVRRLIHRLSALPAFANRRLVCSMLPFRAGRRFLDAPHWSGAELRLRSGAGRRYQRAAWGLTAWRGRRL